MFHKNTKYLIAYNVRSVLCCILILLYCKNKLCQRSRTQKHIFVLFFHIGWCHWTMVRVPEWVFQQWWWICTDPFTHSHPVPLLTNHCESAKIINHSRLRVNSPGMNKDNWLSRQQFISVLLISWLWYILTLHTSIFLAPHPTNKKSEIVLINDRLILTKSLSTQWPPPPVVLYITDLHYKYFSIIKVRTGS